MTLKCKFSDGEYATIEEKEISNDELTKLKLRIREEVSNISLKLNLNSNKNQEDKYWRKRVEDALEYRKNNLELIKLEEIRRFGEVKHEKEIEHFFMQIASKELSPPIYTRLYEQAEKLMEKEKA